MKSECSVPTLLRIKIPVQPKHRYRTSLSEFINDRDIRKSNYVGKYQVCKFSNTHWK